MMSFIRKFNIILQSGYRRFSSTASKRKKLGRTSCGL